MKNHDNKNIVIKARNYNLFVEDETTEVDQQYIPPINNQPFDYYMKNLFEVALNKQFFFI